MEKRRSALWRGIGILLCAAVILAALLGVAALPVRAENKDEVTYKKKIVSVLFDNSFSMGEQTHEDRTELAKYSLEILASLLGADDELYLTPMNQQDGEGQIALDLSAADREKEIEEKIVKNTALNPCGQTPYHSMGRALDSLKQRGLMIAGDSPQGDVADTEYWFVILTDGAFDSTGDPDPSKQSLKVDTAAVIEEYIKQYTGLNTIYISFGGGRDLKDPQNSLNRNYPFFPYHVKAPGELAACMQEVANKISRRYGLSGEQFSVSGNEVTVELTHLKFAVNNIAVIAQDCGAKLTEVNYGDQKLPVIQKSSLFGTFEHTEGGIGDPVTVEIIGNGFVSVVSDETCLSEGEVKFVFDKEVKNVSVLVEPALYINAYLEREGQNGWERTDVQEINSKMCPGDEVRVGYKVYSSATDEEVSLEEIFGTPTEKVTYCGKGYKVGEPFPLEKGSNSVSVAISVLNDAYTMTYSILCYIEENPNDYRLEGALSKDESGKKATIEYTLYAGGQPVDKAGLEGYTTAVSVVYPGGEEHELAFQEVRDDGTMVLSFDGEGLGFGMYSFRAQVTEKESNVSRTSEIGFLLLPTEFTVACETEERLETTMYLLGDKTFNVEFSLTVDGKESSFEIPSLRYTVTLGDKDVTQSCVVIGEGEVTQASSVKEGRLVFPISKETLPKTEPSEWTLTVTATYFDQTTGKASYAFEIKDSVFRVEVLEEGARELDIVSLQKTNAAVSFKVYKDEAALSEEAANAALEAGEIELIDGLHGPLGSICEIVTKIEDGGGEAVITRSVVQKMPQIFAYFAEIFVGGGQRTVGLTYCGAEGNGTIDVLPLSAGEKIWRIALIFLILLAIAYIVLYIIGFFKAKHYPKGTFVYVDIGEGEKLKRKVYIAYHKINFGFGELLRFHLSRLYPSFLRKDVRRRHLFKSQGKRENVFKGITIRISEEKGGKASFVMSIKSKTRTSHIVSGGKKEVRELVEDVEIGKIGKKSLNLTRGAFLSCFSNDSVYAPKSEQNMIGWVKRVHTDRITKKEVVDAVIGFIPYNKKSKRRRH